LFTSSNALRPYRELVAAAIARQPQVSGERCRRGDAGENDDVDVAQDGVSCAFPGSSSNGIRDSISVKTPQTCSNCNECNRLVSCIEQAIRALDSGDVVGARAILADLLVAGRKD